MMGATAHAAANGAIADLAQVSIHCAAPDKRKSASASPHIKEC